MASKIFDALLEEKIEIFKNSFSNTAYQVFYDDKDKQLIHPSEFGVYREALVIDFIRFFVPRSLEIDSGFIITPSDNISTQCDIIIYDINVTPMIQSKELQKFFPVETIIGIGEVKSSLSKQAFVEALNKLAKIKKLREDIPDPNIRRTATKNQEYNPKLNPFDNVFSFLICKKLDFKLDKVVDELNNDIYDSGIRQYEKHNLILSIDDGLFLYDLPQDNGSMPFGYPILRNKGELKNRHIRLNPQKPLNHFKTFANCLFNGTADATVLFPEMVDYMAGYTPVRKII